MSKRERQRSIIEIVRSEEISSQEQLRTLLAARGYSVSQGTLSRDLHELRLGKVLGPEGRSRYAVPDDHEHTPVLRSLLPSLMLSAEPVGNLLVVRTRRGSAGPVAEAIDEQGWPDIAGTIAGDDTILVVLRRESAAASLAERLESLRSRS